MRSENRIYLSGRLQGRMDECFSNGLSVVRAPAGFGKSVCTGEYFKRCVSSMARVFWISCDMPAAEFSKQFVQCVSVADPKAGERLRLLGQSNTADYHHVTEAVKTITSQVPVWFVLDAPERLPTYLRTMCELLQSPADENVHFVILTRGLPEIEAAQVTAEDLTLTEEELGEFFADERIDADSRELAGLYKATSGFLTAAALVAQCVKTTGKLPESADIDYLLGSIYDELPGEKRRMLRRICNFNTLTTPQIQFLLEERELPEETRRFLMNFPLIRYCRREKLWHVHELLTGYIISNSSDIVSLARAAAWYAQTGQTGRAVECYYGRLDYEGILSLDLSKVDAGESICGRPFIQIVRELSRCPAEMKIKYPLNMLRAAHLLFGEGDYAAYDALMSEMETIILETGDERVYGEWILESAWQAYPDMTAMLSRVERAAKKLNGHSRMVGPGDVFAFGSPSMWMVFHSTSGQADREAVEFERLVAAYSEITGGNGLGADMVFRGELHCARGQLDAAQTAACEAEAVALANGQLSVAADALYLQGKIAVDRMDTDHAALVIKRLDRLPENFQNGYSVSVSRQLAAVKAMLMSMIKKSGQQQTEPVVTGAGPMSMLLRLVEASRLIETNKYGEVAGMLEALLTIDTRSCTLAYKHYVYTGLAICYSRMGRGRQALSCLQMALDLSKQDGNLMTFARCWPDLERLLEQCRGEYGDTVATISALREGVLPDTKCSYKSASRASVEERLRNLPEPLTDREIEIAELAAQGMRNKEIAAMLFLSERTVSNRLYTIFQKLNIDRRSELIDLLK